MSNLNSSVSNLETDMSSALYHIKSLTSSDDLDDYHFITGYYSFASGSRPQNMPSGDKGVNGMVIVYKTEIQDMAKQQVFQWQSGIEYSWTRRWYNGSFGDWQTLY